MNWCPPFQKVVHFSPHHLCDGLKTLPSICFLIYSQTCHLASSKGFILLVFTIIATFSGIVIYHSLGGVRLWKCPGSPQRDEKATKQNENCICCHPSRDPLRALSADTESHSSRVASVQRCGEISCQIHHLNYLAVRFHIMDYHV